MHTTQHNYINGIGRKKGKQPVRSFSGHLHTGQALTHRIMAEPSLSLSPYTLVYHHT